MKKLMLLLAAVMIFISANFAYALPQFWFSGYAQDNTGAVLYSTTLPVIVTIYEGDTQVFTETHAAVAINEFGMFQVKVGSVGAGLGAITIKANTKIRLTVNGVICNPGSVLTQDIVNYSIMPGAITLTNGKMLVGDALNQAAEVSMGGDATITNTGVLTLAAGSVETSNIIDANVTGAKLENYGPGAATYGDATNFPIVTLDAKGRVSNITTSPIPAEVDGIIGNEVTDAANTTLTRTGLGTTVSPYKLELNLGNLNTWTGTQTFQDIIVDMGIIEGTDIGQVTPGLGTFTTLGATTSNLGNVASGTWNGTNIALSKIATGAANQFLVNAAGTNSWAGLNLTANFIGNAVGTALDLSNTGVVANTYGDATNVPQITVDAKGRITGVTNVAITHPAEVDPVWVAAEPNYANLGQAEVITANWDNTANPWADNEVANNLTIVAGTVDNTVIGGVTPAAGTFTTLTATTSNLGTVATGVWNGTPIVSAYIADGTIVDADIANATITNAKLVNSAVNFTSTSSTLTVPASIALGATGNFEINLNTANAWVGVQSGNITANLVTTAAGTSIVTAINDGATVGTINTNRLNTAVVLETENPAAAEISGSYTAGFTINNDAVVTAKILDGNVTNAKLANSSITVNTTAPLTGGATPALGGSMTISMPAATAIADGYLTMGDWATFNAKEEVLTFNAPLNRAVNTVSLDPLTNAHIDVAAAIAYSKLNLAGSIVNADVAAGANISYSKLNLANSIVTGDIVNGTIVDADVNAAAAIAATKIANGTVDNTEFQLLNGLNGIVNLQSDAGISVAQTGLVALTSASAFDVLNVTTTGASAAINATNNNAGAGAAIRAVASTSSAALVVENSNSGAAAQFTSQDGGGAGIFVTNDGGSTPTGTNYGIELISTNANEGLYVEKQGGAGTANAAYFKNTQTSGTAIKLNATGTNATALNVEAGRVRFAVAQVSDVTNLATTTGYSIIDYTDNNNIAMGNMPTGLDGEIIYIVNKSGGAITVLGTNLNNNAVCTLVWLDTYGEWYRLP